MDTATRGAVMPLRYKVNVLGIGAESGVFPDPLNLTQIMLP